MGSWIYKDFSRLFCCCHLRQDKKKPILFFFSKEFPFFSNLKYWCVVYTFFESRKIVKCWALLHIMVHLEGEFKPHLILFSNKNWEIKISNVRLTHFGLSFFQNLSNSLYHKIERNGKKIIKKKKGSML